jgi:hypothetical protein
VSKICFLILSTSLEICTCLRRVIVRFILSYCSFFLFEGVLVRVSKSQRQSDYDFVSH